MQRLISELLQRRGMVLYTGPTTPVDEAVALMAEHNVGSLLVLENNADLVGIFTERDLLCRVVNERRAPENTLIRDVMTEDVIVVSEDTPRSDVINLMNEKQFRHAPVASEGNIIGVVSLRDLLRFEHEMQEFEIEQLREYVREKPYPTYPG